MHSATLETATVESTVRNKTAQQPRQKSTFVFVLELHDGRFVIGQAANACRRISAFNSGLTPGFPKPLMVKRIVGVKDRTEDRCIISTYKRFADQYGADNVIAV